MKVFAHAGHQHNTDMNMTGDHCMPLVVGTGIIIVILLVVILYLLRERNNRQAPKKRTQPKK